MHATCTEVSMCMCNPLADYDQQKSLQKCMERIEDDSNQSPSCWQVAHSSELSQTITDDECNYRDTYVCEENSICRGRIIYQLQHLLDILDCIKSTCKIVVFRGNQSYIHSQLEVREGVLEGGREPPCQ